MNRPPGLTRTHENAWQQAVTDFSEHLARTGQPSPETAADYCRRVFYYGRDLPSGPWQLTAKQLTTDLDAQNWSRATRKAALVALRRFYTWAVLSGRVQRSPLLGVSDGLPKRPGPLQVEPAPLWQDAVHDYLTTLRAGGRRPATIDTYRNHLTMLSHAFAHPWRVSTDDLALLLSRQDWSPEMRRSVRGVICRFYRWAVQTDRIERDPTLTLAVVRVPRSLPRPAPDDAVMTALAHADRRTRLAIELGMYAGLRRAEVACLSVADVTGAQIMVTGKGGHQRRVPIHPTLHESIAAEISRRAHSDDPRDETPWLFPSQNGGHLTARHLGRLVSLALPENWTHHSLRHRFATQAYAAQRDLRAVQELLGHMNPETTTRYAAVPDNALSAAVAGVGLPTEIWKATA